MKTTLDLPEDLVQRIKIRAVQERTPMKRLVADMFTQSLDVPVKPAISSYPEPLPEGIMLNERGFPVFRCGPHAPASKMKVEELLALEQESQLKEDMQRAGISR